MAWRRNSFLGPAEIASFVFLVLFKRTVDSRRRVSTRLHLFVSDVNQRNEVAVWVQDFFAWLQGWKDYPWIFRELLQNRKCALEVGSGGVLRSWVRGICNRKVIWGEILWLYNLKNFTCGDQQILLIVIWLVLTRVETEEISYERFGSCVSWTCFRGWG